MHPKRRNRLETAFHSTLPVYLGEFKPAYWSVSTLSTGFPVPPYKDLTYALVAVQPLEHSKDQSRVFRPGLLSLLEREVTYALDSFCNSVGAVAVGNREFVHAGWVHPHSLSGGGGGAADPVDNGSQTCPLRARHP